MARDNIRNFCIIAHIDHGKSTLSDRILELTKSVDERTMEDQILDNMDIERERGITIKARAVTMNYTAKDGKVYEFNLIDTPGHVDFAYEVSRSLAACEGAILVVDATQGVEAQTLANTYMALEHDLELVPILNKIDLPSAHPDEVAQEVEDVIGLPCLDAPRVSAKTGLNIDQVLERVVSDIPAPTGDPDAPLKALIFDSIYDSYKGVIVYIRVFEGTVKPGDTIRLMATGAQFTLVEVGHMGATSLTPCDQLQAGEVGYLTASIKTVQDTRVGDTVTLANDPTPEALPGYRQVKPMVFCGIYPADGAKYPDLKDALEKRRAVVKDAGRLRRSHFARPPDGTPAGLDSDLVGALRHAAARRIAHLPAQQRTALPDPHGVGQMLGAKLRHGELRRSAPRRDDRRKKQQKKSFHGR